MTTWRGPDRDNRYRHSAHSSRELLAFLATRLHDEPVMVVGTMREEELEEGTQLWFAELAHRPAVTRLRLERLTDAEVTELVAGWLPAGASAKTRSAVVAAAGGNPLYARELARAGRPGPPRRSAKRCRQGPLA